jgi:hypothetical protein
VSPAYYAATLMRAVTEICPAAAKLPLAWFLPHHHPPTAAEHTTFRVAFSADNAPLETDRAYIRREGLETEDFQACAVAHACTAHWRSCRLPKNTFTLHIKEY